MTSFDIYRLIRNTIYKAEVGVEYPGKNLTKEQTERAVRVLSVISGNKRRVLEALYEYLGK